MQEMQVRPLGQEDPLEKEMATQSSILAWRIPIHGVTEESDMSGQLNNSNIQFFSLFFFLLSILYFFLYSFLKFLLEYS